MNSDKRQMTITQNLGIYSFGNSVKKKTNYLGNVFLITRYFFFKLGFTITKVARRETR